MWTALLIAGTTTIGYYLGGHYPDATGEFHQYLGATVGFFVVVILKLGISGGIADAFDTFVD